MYPEILEQYWLRRACRTLEIEDPREALQALEPEIMALSDLFTVKRAPGFAGYADDPRRRLAYALFYLPQTFTRIAFILEECVAAGWRPTAGRPLRVLDLGAGLGAAGFAAAQSLEQPLHLCVTDTSAQSLDVLGESFQVARDHLWPEAQLETRTVNLLHALRDQDEPWDLILCSFALNEALETTGETGASEWIERALAHLAPGGLFVLCEPAAEQTSARVEQLRDHVAAAGLGRIVAPCPHHQPCPLLREGRVYCHEVRRWTPPASLSYLNQRLARFVQYLKFSFLAVCRAPVDTAVPDAARARLVAPITEETGKLITRGCASDGAVYTYEVLTRHLTREDRDAARAVERGSRVTWGDLQPLRNGALRAGKLPDLNR